MAVPAGAAEALTIASIPVARTPMGVVDFVDRNPPLIQALTRSDRISLLKILTSAFIVRTLDQGGCQRIQAAAAALMKPIGPGDLSHIIAGVGGLPYLQENINRLTNVELKGYILSASAPTAAALGAGGRGAL
jgi:hypothetical protein